MALNPEQLAILKAHIVASADLNSQPDTPDGDFEIARLLEQPASPDFWVWRTSVEKKEVVTQTSRNGTTFIWAGNGFINRSAGELECWNQLFNSTLTCNPSLPNVRQAFIDIFSGAGNAANNRQHLDAIARRKATRLEKLFATGQGLDTLNGSGTMTVEGAIGYSEVRAARNLP